MLMLGFEGLTRFYDTFALSRVKIMEDSSKISSAILQLIGQLVIFTIIRRERYAIPVANRFSICIGFPAL